MPHLLMLLHLLLMLHLLVVLLMLPGVTVQACCSLHGGVGGCLLPLPSCGAGRAGGCHRVCCPRWRTLDRTRLSGAYGSPGGPR